MPTSAGPHKSPAWRRRLYLPAYQVTEAARYAGASSQTIHSWHYGGGPLGPTLPGKERGTPLSYLQLVEVAFVATFRHLGVSMPRIRRARDYAATKLQTEYPFAEYRFQTEGYHVLLDLQQFDPSFSAEHFVLADAHGQLAWQETVGERFAEFDYEDGLAVTWYLRSRNSPVVIDPRISFGAPMVEGIPTWVIKGRYDSGEPVEEISDDFGVETSQIQAALRFEGIQIDGAAA